MRVALDLTALLPRPTGVDWYLLGLARALARTDHETDYRLYVNAEDRGRLGELPPNFRVLARAARPRAARLAFQQGWLPAAAFAADVIHSPSFIAPLAPTRARHLLNVHDMTSFSLPDLHIPLRRSAAYQRAVVASIRRAHRVHVPSRFVEQDVERFVPGLPEGRVRVEHLAIGDDFRPHGEDEIAPVLDRLGVRRPYVVFVGTIQPRKDVGGLLDAVARLTTPGVQLVVAGQLGWGHDGLVDRLRTQPGVRWLDYVDQADLPALTAGAAVAAYPSVSEGFGLPPVEAMAAGVPVVTTNATSLGELLDGAAELVPVRDPDALARAIDRVLTDEDRRAELVAAGHERAARFRWDAAARRMAAIYRELAQPANGSRAKTRSFE